MVFMETAIVSLIKDASVVRHHCIGNSLNRHLGQGSSVFAVQKRCSAATASRAWNSSCGACSSSRNAAAAENGSIVLCSGILLTLEKQHLTLDYMTPSPRYLAIEPPADRDTRRKVRVLDQGRRRVPHAPRERVLGTTDVVV
jgi:hypothetical protein